MHTHFISYIAGVGQQCTSNDDCSAVHTECVNYVCTCMPGYSAKTGTCTRKSQKTLSIFLKFRVFKENIDNLEPIDKTRNARRFCVKIRLSNQLT